MVDEYFLDQFNKPHALVDGESKPLTNGATNRLRNLLWEAETKTTNRETLGAAVGTLAAFAAYSGNRHDLHVRYARHDGKLYAELSPGSVVEIGPGYWRTVEQPPVRFRPIGNLKPLPAPLESADAPLADSLMVQHNADTYADCRISTIKPIRNALSSDSLLYEFVNLKHPSERRLFVTYLVLSAVPDIPRPILGATGVMGSGKSSLSRFVKRTIDPSTPEAIRFDRPIEVLQKASHCHILMVDNASSFPEWAEDMVCKFVTGEADSKRQLYSDDEYVIYELMRAVLVSSIKPPSERETYRTGCSL